MAPGISYIPLLHKVVDLKELLNVPSFHDSWSMEFLAISRAGLNSSYIWLTIFGYVYSDIGWLTLIYFFVLGMVAKTLWQAMLSGRAFALVLYPSFAFSILFWFGTNLFLRSTIFTFTALAIALSALEGSGRISSALIGRRIAPVQHLHFGTPRER